jgi:hypothetical protein
VVRSAECGGKAPLDALWGMAATGLRRAQAASGYGEKVPSRDK